MNEETKKQARKRNVIWHDHLVTRHDRNVRNRHRSGLIWFTGLPSAGKSTIAHQLEKELFDRGIRCYVLDGDNVRHGLTADLGFSREDRKENLRRIAEVGRLFVDAGFVVIAAFVSPYRKDREFIRGKLGEEHFFEVFIECSPEVAETRDPKGNYRKAREGIIKNYTGVSAPYEAPDNPDLVINTEQMGVGECVRAALEFLDERKFILLM
jgi:adenylylsulfate kinase